PARERSSATAGGWCRRALASASIACATSSSSTSLVDCSRVTMPTLCPAMTEPFSTSPSTTAQRARPEMLDLELRLLLRQLAAPEALENLPLQLEKAPRSLVGERAHRDHRKARVELHRWHRIACDGANEGLLEARMGDRFMGADKARAELYARCAHLEIGDDRLAAADAASDEDRHLGDVRQD